MYHIWVILIALLQASCTKSSIQAIYPQTHDELERVSIGSILDINGGLFNKVQYDRNIFDAAIEVLRNNKFPIIEANEKIGIIKSVCTDSSNRKHEIEITVGKDTIAITPYIPNNRARMNMIDRLYSDILSLSQSLCESS